MTIISKEKVSCRNNDEDGFLLECRTRSGDFLWLDIDFGPPIIMLGNKSESSVIIWLASLWIDLVWLVLNDFNEANFSNFMVSVSNSGWSIRLIGLFQKFLVVHFIPGNLYTGNWILLDFLYDKPEIEWKLTYVR